MSRWVRMGRCYGGDVISCQNLKNGKRNNKKFRKDFHVRKSYNIINQVISLAMDISVPKIQITYSIGRHSSLPYGIAVHTKLL